MTLQATLTPAAISSKALTNEKREARSEKREARSEKREARSEKREARSEKREARSEKREARSEKREARSEKRENFGRLTLRRQPFFCILDVSSQQKALVQIPTQQL
ncbi:hypothetical protein L1D52_07685 [Vibrio brasiliensis]|uniref:hypothetical protein n=1 Tax=Vibrio brasiliensis TaxID=170652 RepID=UPI001EFDD16D|nr:hypothetical protein [Vibrio brasiliensis]MCG9782236.1 hypothetical protein [Vibrio brasiliensis]